LVQKRYRTDFRSEKLAGDLQLQIAGREAAAGMDVTVVDIRPAAHQSKCKKYGYMYLCINIEKFCLPSCLMDQILTQKDRHEYTFYSISAL
jgi:hypothetical protein